MPALSTAAWIAHDLGLATGLGGTLFGRMALHPAIRHISDREERGQVVSDAWRVFNTIHVPALTVMAVTWWAGRRMLSGREVDRLSRRLVLLKDVLVAGTVGTGLGAAIVGRKLSALRPGGALPLDRTGELSVEAPAQARRLNRLVDRLGMANLILGAGVVAVTTVLAMRAGESGRWSLISRFLK